MHICQKNEYVRIVYYQHFDFIATFGHTGKSLLLRFHHSSHRQMIYGKSVLTLQMLHFVLSVYQSLWRYFFRPHINCGEPVSHTFSIQIPFNLRMHLHQSFFVVIFGSSFSLWNFSIIFQVVLEIDKCLPCILRLLHLVFFTIFLSDTVITARGLFSMRHLNSWTNNTQTSRWIYNMCNVNTKACVWCVFCAVFLFILSEWERANERTIVGAIVLCKHFEFGKWSDGINTTHSTLHVQRVTWYLSKSLKMWPNKMLNKSLLCVRIVSFWSFKQQQRQSAAVVVVAITTEQLSRMREWCERMVSNIVDELRKHIKHVPHRRSECTDKYLSISNSILFYKQLFGSLCTRNDFKLKNNTQPSRTGACVNWYDRGGWGSGNCSPCKTSKEFSGYKCFGTFVNTTSIHSL